MSGKNTTGAVHLTTIDLDISGVRKSLEEVDALIQEASKKAKESFDSSFGGGDGSGGSTGGGMFGSSLAGIESLELQYRQFINTVQGSKLGNDAVTQLTSAAKEGLEDIRALKLMFDDSGKAMEGVGQKAAELRSDLKGLKGEYADLSASAKEASRNLTETDATPSFIATQKQIESLNLSYKNLIGTVNRANIVPTEEFITFQTALSNADKELQSIVETSRSGVPVTEEQSRAYQTLELTLTQLKAAWAEMNKVSAPTQTTATAKQVENLNLAYKNFLNTLTKTKLTDTTLGDIPKRAQDAAQKMAALAEETKGSAKITAEQQKKFEELASTLTTLKGNLADTEANARRTGDGFKQLGENAEQSTSLVTRFIGALGDKVKWMAAFAVVNQIRQAFGNVISTIKETEDAVIEIQRVLNDPSLADSKVSQELYDIAYEYGQTFDNVQEAFVKFAQTGKTFEESAAATRATMLALNTAELEVGDATTGLIAVMAQFGIEAADLEAVIDKINITADNFPVTSEKIVSALQRAGGTANAFGLSLEETISVITALSEATGRAGANIGTALNSLILFTQKESALSKFSDYLGVDASQFGVLELWQELGKAIQGNEEELAKWMAQSEEASDLFSEEIADALDLTELRQQAVDNAQEVYSAAGTFRQNYFIALLKNIQTVSDAMETMAGAEGYSLSENERAMNTLTHQWNQLVSAARELAVQFGEMGFLDLLKWLTNAATAVLKFTKEIGGLRTALVGLGAALATVKAIKIQENLQKGTGALSNLIYWVKASTTSVADFKAGVSLAGEGVVKWATSLQGAVTIAGIAATAITALVTVYQNYKRAQEEARQATISEGEQAAKEADNLYQLYSAYLTAQQAYKDTGEATGDLKTASDELLTTLAQEGLDVTALAGNYDELAESIKEIISLRLEDKLVQQSNQLEAAKDSARDYFTNALGWAKEFNSVWWDDEHGTKGYGKIHFADIDEFEKEYDRLTARMEQLRERYGPIDVATDEEYKAIKAIVDQYTPYIQKIREAEEAQTRTIEQLEKVKNGTVELADGLDDAGSSIEGAVESFHDCAKELEYISAELDRVKSATSSFSSSWSSLVSVVDDFNKSGEITAENLEKLLELEPEYIALLEFKNGQLTLNEEGTERLISANEQYMQQLVALRIAEEAEKLMTDLQAAAKDNLTLAEYRAQVAAGDLSNEIYVAALNMIQGKGTAIDFANALNSVGQSAGLAGDYLGYFAQQMQSMFSGYSSLLSMPRSISLPSIQGGVGGSSGGGSSGKNPEKEAIQAEIDAWKKRQEEVKDYYSNLKDSTKDYYDGLIDQLKEVQEQNDRINKQLDYYNNRQKIITNLEQARARSGVEWREKEMEYQQELMDLDEGWRRTQQDWDIDDRIKELEKLKETALAQIEEAMKATLAEIETVIETLQEKANSLATSTGSAAASGISSSLGNVVSDANEAFAEIESAGNAAIKSMTMGLAAGMDAAVDTMSQIDKFGSSAVSSIAAGVSKLRNEWIESVPQMGSAFYKGFTAPVLQDLNAIQQQMANVMRASTLSVVGGAALGIAALNGYSGGLPSMLGSQTTNTNTVNMYANIGNTTAANATANSIANIMRAERF